MAELDYRKLAREQNQRDGLGPITDPAVLTKVARLILASRKRKEDEHHAS